MAFIDIKEKTMGYALEICSAYVSDENIILTNGPGHPALVLYENNGEVIIAWVEEERLREYPNLRPIPKGTRIEF